MAFAWKNTALIIIFYEKVIFQSYKSPQDSVAVAYTLAGMAEWLDGSALALRAVGLSHSLDLLPKMQGEYLPTLYNSRWKGK